jgi:elongation factor 1-gamma
LNTVLEGKDWLVGTQITLADVIVQQVLKVPLQTVLDAGFRKGTGKNVEKWALAYYANEVVVKHEGKVQLAAKPLKPVLLEEKKAPKVVAQVAAKPKEVVVKPKDNIESLPPTDFVIYDYKTFLVNHPDKGGVGMDESYKQIDWNGWSYWFFHYEKFGKEGQVLFSTNNLVTGFLSRAEHTSKYTFARHGVFGEEPNLEVMGVWLCRGPTEIPDGL